MIMAPNSLPAARAFIKLIALIFSSSTRYNEKKLEIEDMLILFRAMMKIPTTKARSNQWPVCSTPPRSWFLGRLGLRFQPSTNRKNTQLIIRAYVPILTLLVRSG